MVDGVPVSIVTYTPDVAVERGDVVVGGWAVRAGLELFRDQLLALGTVEVEEVVVCEVCVVLDAVGDYPYLRLDCHLCLPCRAGVVVAHI